jgi:hypothetical protein
MNRANKKYLAAEEILQAQTFDSYQMVLSHSAHHEFFKIMTKPLSS